MVGPDRIQLPEFETLRDLSREAIEFGLESPGVRSYLRSLGFDLTAYDPLSTHLEGPERLSDTEARKRRLQQASRLEADIRSLTTEEPQSSVFPA